MTLAVAMFTPGTCGVCVCAFFTVCVCVSDVDYTLLGSEARCICILTKTYFVQGPYEFHATVQPEEPAKIPTIGFGRKRKAAQAPNPQP